MVLSNEKVNEIIENGSKKGFSIRVRDISYAILALHYEEKEMAYKSIFGAYSDDFDEYSKNDTTIFVTSQIESLLNPKSKKKKEDDITFEENKAEIINLIKETKEKEQKGEIDAKQSLDLQTKLRITLNDKFRVQEDSKEQLVIVTQKYDDICPYCSHEVSRRPMTEEEAIIKYNLVKLH